MCKLWLDDLRDPVKYGQPDAIWFKTFQDFILKGLGDWTLRSQVTEIHFDNDLGEESLEEGYDAFLIIEQELFGHQAGEGLGIPNLKTIYVHSSNPSAVHKFMLAARTFKYHFGIEVLRNQY